MSEPESTTQRVGQLLKDRYRIERVLHADAQACVYAGTDTRTAPHARVAIKLLPPERARDQAFHDRFVQQAYLANAVGHPGAVTVLDTGATQDGAAFLVMELLTAPSLASLRAEYGGKLPLRLACAIADQCLDVLACAHPQQICICPSGRALSPERLFWAHGSQLKVLGFGAMLIERTQEPDATHARHADLKAVAGLWNWLLGDDATVAPPQSLRAVFDKACNDGWPSADAMRRALMRAHRTELGSRVDAASQPTAAGGGLDAPLSWLWIWLAAAGLAVGLLALSALVSEPERPPRRNAEGSAPVAEATTHAEPANAGVAVPHADASVDVQASEAQEEEEERAPTPSGPRAQEHGAVQPRVIPRGPSLKALQLPMLGRRSESPAARAGLIPVATAHRLCTELAAHRRQEPLTVAEQGAWDEHCLKQ